MISKANMRKALDVLNKIDLNPEERQALETVRGSLEGPKGTGATPGEPFDKARLDDLQGALEIHGWLTLEDSKEALAEIERAWGEIERKVEIMANEHETACRIAAENSTLSKRLSHAHDAANALYRAAMAVEAHRSTGPGWSQSIDFRDLLDALRRAIDPTHLEAAALEAARRDGLDARCKELEAEIERLRARPTLTEEQAETLTDMIESVESPASEGWTLPSGQNVIIKAPGGHLSIVHTSSLQRWAEARQVSP